MIRSAASQAPALYKWVDILSAYRALVDPQRIAKAVGYPKLLVWFRQSVYHFSVRLAICDLKPYPWM